MYSPQSSTLSVWSEILYGENCSKLSVLHSYRAPVISLSSSTSSLLPCHFIQITQPSACRSPEFRACAYLWARWTSVWALQWPTISVSYITVQADRQTDRQISRRTLYDLLVYTTNKQQITSNKLVNPYVCIYLAGPNVIFYQTTNNNLPTSVIVLSLRYLFLYCSTSKC